MAPKVQQQIGKWQTRKAEIKRPEPSAAASSQTGEMDAINDTHVQSDQAEQIHAPPDERPMPTDNDFADLALKACLLCQRQFKSIDDLKRHQAISELHKVL